MKLTKTLLASMVALSLSVPMTSHAELPKAISTPINKVANLLGFGDDVQADSGLDVEAETGEQVADGEQMDAQDPTSPTLDALGSKPNTLHGIEGLHQGRVPLGAVSPNTLKTFVSVVDLVRRDYVEEVSDEKLFENAMSGMLTGLDSHAEFWTKKPLPIYNHSPQATWRTSDCQQCGKLMKSIGSSPIFMKTHLPSVLV